MSKAERRTKKELEKAWKAGRYWEWLAQVEKEGLRRELAGPWLEAWKSLVKRALRLPANLEEFWAGARELKDFPELPDLHGLLLLGDFVEGREVREKIAALKNLTFPAEALRKRALAWQEESDLEEKIRDILSGFLSEPGQVSGDVYRELSSLTRGSSLSAPLADLGARIDFLRGREAGKKKGRGRPKKAPPFDWGRLQGLDFPLREVSSRVAPALSGVLLYPFLFHLSELLRGLAKRGQDRLLASASSSAPFALSLLAGEKAAALQEKLLRLGGNFAAEADPVMMDRKIRAGGLEEKLPLLKIIRPLAHSEGEREIRGVWIGRFRELYRGILADLAARQKALSDRERRGLVPVMAPVIRRDLSILWAEPEDLADLLGLIAAAGLLDRTWAVLCLLLWRWTPDALRQEAMAMLRGQPAPSPAELSWFFEETSELVFPRFSAFRPLLQLWGADRPFVANLVLLIGEQMECAFVSFQAVGRGGAIPFIREEIAAERQEMLAAMSRELNSFQDQPAFVFLRDFLKAFPQGRLTAEGYAIYFKMISAYGMELGRAIDSLSREAENGPSFTPGGLAPFMLGGLNTVQGERRRGFLLFLQGNLGILKTCKIEEAERLLHFLAEQKELRECAPVMIGLANALGERAAAGEKTAGPIHEKAMRLLIDMKRRTRGGQYR